MLRVGLTGGIGSGKSTVARRLVQRGAWLVDADLLAREVVAPGSDGLAEIVAAFGTAVLDADGALDRPALAAVVFGDRAARERLNGIVHPRVRRRSDRADRRRAGRRDRACRTSRCSWRARWRPRFPLVVVVHADADERVERLVRQRGMSEADARARVAAQADDEARRAAADVWLDNSGAPTALDAAVDELWQDRLVPFERNLRLRRPASTGSGVVVEADPRWAADGARLAARLAAAAGDRGRAVAHVGPTAVPGTAAEDVLDLQLGVVDPADVDGLRDALADAGFPPGPDPQPAGRHASADPGRPARVVVCPIGSPEWRNALLHRDWLRAGSPAVPFGGHRSRRPRIP